MSLQVPPSSPADHHAELKTRTLKKIESRNMKLLRGIDQKINTSQECLDHLKALLSELRNNNNSTRELEPIELKTLLDKGLINLHDDETKEILVQIICLTKTWQLKHWLIAYLVGKGLQLSTELYEVAERLDRNGTLPLMLRFDPQPPQRFMECCNEHDIRIISTDEGTRTFIGENRFDGPDNYISWRWETIFKPLGLVGPPVQFSEFQSLVLYLEMSIDRLESKTKACIFDILVSGDILLASYLISIGFDFNGYQRTATHAALMLNNWNVAEMLMRFGDDPNRLDEDDNSALSYLEYLRSNEL